METDNQITNKPKSRETYKVTWQWYQFIKGDTLAGFTNTDYLDSFSEAKEFLGDRKSPSKGMKLRYRIDKVITELVEEAQ